MSDEHFARFCDLLAASGLAALRSNESSSRTVLHCTTRHDDCLCSSTTASNHRSLASLIVTASLDLQSACQTILMCSDVPLVITLYIFQRTPTRCVNDDTNVMGPSRSMLQAYPRCVSRQKCVAYGSASCAIVMKSEHDCRLAEALAKFHSLTALLSLFSFL